MTIRFLSTLTLIILLIQSSIALSAELTSTVDRNRITINDTLSLTVKLDQQADSNSLNLTGLQADFDVLGISPLNSSSITVNNGKTEQIIYTQWSITLAPKREGTLTIPAFNVGGAQSRPINIAVTSSGTANAATSPLSVSVMASEVDAFVKQQIILTIELSAQTNVGNLDGSPLSIDNAEIRDLGQSSGTQIDNGVARQIIQLRYAIFPKQAGQLSVPSLTFTGVQGGSRGFFGSRGNRVVARSKALTLNIKEQPNSTFVWLPSENVSIRSELSGDASQYQVGAPITRRITIEAQGQTAEAIPPVSNNQPGTNQAQAFKSYEDKPQLNTANSAQGLVGTRIESMAIVPSIAGELTLPGFKLNWWDVKTQQWRQASVPEETINVAASSSQKPSVTQTENQSLDSTAPVGNLIDNTSTQRYPWLWQVIAAILFLVCLVQFILLKRRPAVQAQPSNNTERSENENKAWKTLKSSLDQGEPSSIRKSTLEWAKLIHSDIRPMTLNVLAKMADSPELTNAFANLESQLYGNSSEALSKQEINTIRDSLKQFRQNSLNKHAKANDKNNSLKPLYPQ